jgi:hypothetical protein
MNWFEESNYVKWKMGKWEVTRLVEPRHSQVELNSDHGEITNLMLTAMGFLAPLLWTIYKNKNKNSELP